MPVGSTHSPIGYLDNRAKKRLWITIMSTNRISTGIEELDILMKGGFRSGGTYLVLGQPGTGKTIFGLQFLYRGLLDDQKVIYVAINENPAALIEQATSVGWNLLPYIENNQCLLLRPSAYLNREKLRESDIQQIIEDLNGRIQQTGATRVVIDPLRPLLFTSNSHSLVDDHARIFFNLMQSNAKTTTLLIAHPAARNARAIEEYLVAGTIVLEMELVRSRFVRTLTVEKMRCTEIDPAQYPFTIVNRKGIVLRSPDGNWPPHNWESLPQTGMPDTMI